MSNENAGAAPPGGENGSNGNGTPKFEVRSIQDLAHKYDFTAPGGFVGSDKILDYGEPVLLADSLAPHERGFLKRLLRLP